MALVSGCKEPEREPRRTTTSTTTTQLSARFTVAELLPLDGQFAPYVRVATAGEVLELLGDEEVTLLAPSAEAFDDFGAGNLEALLADPAAAAALARRHVLEGTVTYQDLLDAAGGSVKAVDGTELPVEAGDDGSLTVGGASVVKRDIVAGNGTIHVLDAVIQG